MVDTMRIAGVVKESIVDGKGLRFVVFCQGCPHGCPGCHNPQTHDFSGGYDIELSKIVAEIEKNPLLQGVTFTGGEPFCQAEAFAELGRMIKAIRGMRLNITVYTGFVYEDLCEMAKTDSGIKELLEVADFMIDGPFVLAERDLNLKYRGSRNQRYIDLNLTRVKREVVLAREEENVRARDRYRSRNI